MIATPMTASLGTLVLLALPLAAPAAAAGSAFEYELVIIEPWNTTYSLATSNASGINDLNQVSGAASPLSGSSSFLWTVDTGKVQVNLGGKINDQGVIAGANAVRWPDGSIEVFDLLSVAQDINEQNLVSGTWGMTTCGLSTSDEAGVWDEVNGTRLLQHDFGVLAAEHARALNDHGEVVGVRSSTGTCGDFEAFYLDLASGMHIDLHALLLGTGPGMTQAFDINEASFVIGEGPSGGTLRPFLWHAAEGFTFLPAPAGGAPIDTHLAGLNNANEVVGAARVPDGGGFLDWHAIVWDQALGTRDLNDLVERPAGFTIDAAKEINDNGWIIGSGHYGSWSPTRAVVLIPLAAAPAEAAGARRGGGLRWR